MSLEERIWGIAGTINHKYPLNLKDMSFMQKRKLALLFYLNGLGYSKNAAYLEYVRVEPPFKLDNDLEKKMEEAKRKNKIIMEYTKSEHSLDLGKKESVVAKNLKYSSLEVRNAVHEHLKDEFIKSYLERGIKVNAYAKTGGISESTLYKIIGKGKMKELREKRKDFIYKRFKSEIFNNFNLKITDFCYRYKISTSKLYKMIRENGDDIARLRDGRSYYEREDKFRENLERGSLRRIFDFWIRRAA